MRVRGLLIDLDGTLYTNDGPILGAREALERLGEAGIDYRFVTNATHRPRQGIATHLEALRFPTEEAHIFTPATAAAELLRKEGATFYPLLDDALLEDLAGVPTTDSSPTYVLAGNLGEGFTFERLDAAFQHLMAGADLIALSKNRYWQTAGGKLSLDAGPFVAALEYASSKSATVIGKPERAFFDLALEDMGLPARTVAMVGDDPELDVRGARSAGLQSILVETGRYRAGSELSVSPDLVLPSFAHLPGALGIV